MRKISIDVDWQGGLDIKRDIALAKSADEVGVYSFRVADAWGRDASTTLAVLARGTSQIQFRAGIVNYSRARRLPSRSTSGRSTGCRAGGCSSAWAGHRRAPSSTYAG